MDSRRVEVKLSGGMVGEVWAADLPLRASVLAKLRTLPGLPPSTVALKMCASYIGIPYHYGAYVAPGPGVRVTGFDCSGAVLHWLQLAKRLGLLPSAPGLDLRSSASWAELMQTSPGDGSPWDVACYAGHVQLCVGEGWTIGARGGGRETRGSDPKAGVALRRADYRGDFKGFARWRGPAPSASRLGFSAV